MKNVKGHKKKQCWYEAKKVEVIPFYAKTSPGKKTIKGKRRKKYKGYSFTQSIATKFSDNEKGRNE